MSTATAAPTTVRSRGIPEQYKAILQQILVVAVLILLSVFFTIMKPAFADWSNVSSLLLASVVKLARWGMGTRCESGTDAQR